MADLIKKLTGEADGEPAGFLNEIVAQLWPNMSVYGANMVKQVVEPMFKTMLPGPLSSLHFTKIDFGHVPIKFSNVTVTKTEVDGIKLDMNVDWEGKCDIELDADMMPGLGVESVELYGRLSILLCPLTDTIPLIGAAQVAFINPPVLQLDFTGAANVADFSAIDGTIRNTILGIINSMFTLPNRYLVKLDTGNDYFKTYHYPLGVIRTTVEKAWGFAEEAKGAKKLLSKLTRSEEDCFTEVTVGGEPAWRTSTKNNTTKPSWGETHDFVVSDMHQCIKIDVEDHDVNSNDEVGIAVTTVEDAIKSGGSQEFPLIHKGKDTGGKISLSFEYFRLETDPSSFSAKIHQGDGYISGLATVLIAGAYDIKGQRKELTPSVVVTWGSKHRFQTAVKSDAPGTDINNPAFDQAFALPMTTDVVGTSLRLALMNGEKETGGVDVKFDEVVNAPDMILQKSFEVGNGASVRASVRFRGLVAGPPQQASLPTRGK